MIGILMALALTGSPVEGAVPAKPTVGSVASVFSADDYPPGAADRGEQGKVQVIIHVDEKGSVSSCEIKVSSGYPELDTQTCAIIARRAKFLPARDAQGRPVAAELPETIVWRLETETMPSEPWAMRTILTFPNAGQPPACEVEVEGALAAMASSEPRTCDSSVARLVAPEGLPEPAPMVIFEKRFIRETAEPQKLAPGETLVGRTVLAIDVDSTGKVTGCKIAEQVGEAPEGDQCQAAMAERYAMGAGGDGRLTPFQASLVSTIVIRPGRAAPAGAPDGSGPRH